MIDLVATAREFAIAAHDSIQHKRKYTYEPYWKHCERVAHLVAGVTVDVQIIAAAWLHDVLEDVAPKNPNFDEQAILERCGPHVLQLVKEVTDVSDLNNGNRAMRKQLDREHLGRASSSGKTIKLANLIDNYLDISANDKNFAKIFRQETLLLLPYLKDGDQKLYADLQSLLS